MYLSANAAFNSPSHHAYQTDSKVDENIPQKSCDIVRKGYSNEDKTSTLKYSKPNSTVCAVA